jgi:hypothetical protein
MQIRANDLARFNETNKQSNKQIKTGWLCKTGLNNTTLQVYKMLYLLSLPKTATEPVSLSVVGVRSMILSSSTSRILECVLLALTEISNEPCILNLLLRRVRKQMGS